MRAGGNEKEQEAVKEDKSKFEVILAVVSERALE